MPDVLVEFADGGRFAFEIQYAALTQDEWTWRHAGYLIQGIVDVWLLGHLRRYLRPAAYLSERISLGPLLRTMLAAGARPSWINPDEVLVASRRRISDERWASLFEHREDPEQMDTAALAFDALADCRIEGLLS